MILITFLKVSIILKDDGCFIFEQPYWFEMIDFRIDQIYHEHILLH